MINKIYTLSSGIQVFIIDEVDLDSKKYVLCAVVSKETNDVTDQVAVFEYSASNQSFETIENKEILRQVANIFSEK